MHIHTPTNVHRILKANNDNNCGSSNNKCKKRERKKETQQFCFNNFPQITHFTHDFQIQATTKVRKNLNKKKTFFLLRHPRDFIIQQ